MGRGKKKDPKKKEDDDSKDVEESMSGLTVSSAQPSTSTVTPPEVEEEFEGLTGGITGGSKKKKPQKKKAIAEIEPPKEKQPALKEEPKPQPQEVTKDEDDGFEGLTGSGGNKKRRPKKKKGPDTSDPQQEPSPTSQQGGPPPFQQGGPPPFQQGGPPPFQQGSQGGPPQFQQGSPPQFQQGGPPFQQGGPPFQQGGPSFQQGGPPFQQGGPSFQQGGPPQFQQGGPPQFQQGGPPQFQQGGPPQFQQGVQPFQQGGPTFQQGRPLFQQGGPPFQQGGPPFQQGGPPFQKGGPPSQQRGPPPGWEAPGEPVAQHGSAQPKPPTGWGRGQTPPAEPVPKAQPVAHSAPKPQQSTSLTKPEAPRTPTQTKTAVCRFQIPDKILGRSVRSVPIVVLANYLPMKIKSMSIYRYDVDVKPDKPKKMIPLVFNTFMQQKFPQFSLVAFDQNKNFYSVKKLPNVTSTERYGGPVEVKDPNGRTMNFEITFKSTGVVDLGTIIKYMQGGTSLNAPTEAIQCLDVVLRQGTLKNYVKAGRTFFRKPERPVPLGDGLEMWTGLFQSAIFTSSPYINIDVAHKGFPTQQSIESLLTNSFRLDTRSALEEQNRFAVEAVKKFLTGIKILACVGGQSSQKREYICNGTSLPANRQKFKMTDPSGKQIEMTVADYFAREKNIRLRMPYMNCLWVGPRDKNIHFPMELCEISPNQVCNKQLNDRQLATIVKYAATPPNERKQKIDNIIRDMSYSNNPFYKEFGLQISETFTQVNAKLLNAPIIKYSDKTAKPNNGVWYSSRMLEGSNITKWGIMAVQLDAKAIGLETFIKTFKQTGSGMGVNMGEPAVYLNVPLQKVTQCIQVAKDAQLQILVIILPTRPNDVYQAVKKSAERQVGVLTQCIKEATMQRMSAQTAKNLLLKVNAKMMGTNHSIDRGSLPRCLQAGGVMVVGADVTHPSPDQQNIPSIAAVTASMDVNCFQYNIGLSIQTPKQEVIVEFEDMMVEHLRAYKTKQGSLPKKIYVYRDGVSEGQFGQILNSELVAVYNAYRTMSGSTVKPEVLFLLVQKRHHTRLFNPTDLRSNVVAGTVVDTDIVHPRELDFYLVSHAAIKGTARPTRYHCICNDGKMPHDEVEQLTYYLCHLYSRCSRSVSYPTPTYYAHLACMRARVLTYGEKHNNADLEAKPLRLRILEPMQRRSPMFFV